MTGALNAKTRRAVLQIAEWQEGVVEMPSNSNKVKYNTAYYGREVSGRAYPWCMTFVWWVFREAGFSLYKTASCTAFVNRYSISPAAAKRQNTWGSWRALSAARSSPLRATPAPAATPTAGPS